MDITFPTSAILKKLIEISKSLSQQHSSSKAINLLSSGYEIMIVITISLLLEDCCLGWNNSGGRVFVGWFVDLTNLEVAAILPW